MQSEFRTTHCKVAATLSTPDMRPSGTHLAVYRGCNPCAGWRLEGMFTCSYSTHCVALSPLHQPCGLLLSLRCAATPFPLPCIGVLLFLFSNRLLVYGGAMLCSLWHTCSPLSIHPCHTALAHPEQETQEYRADTKQARRLYPHPNHFFS